MNALSHVERGRQAETIAAAYLVLHGYRILERNWRASRLEIDVIAARGKLLAVVEVKYRDRPRLGGAPAAVTPAKQRDIETATVGYLRVKGLRGVSVRFDVITIEPADRTTGRGLLVKHLPGAFAATGRYRA